MQSNFTPPAPPRIAFLHKGENGRVHVPCHLSDLHIPQTDSEEDWDFLLGYKDNQLHFFSAQQPGLSLHVDFCQPAFQHRCRQYKKELLIQATKVRTSAPFLIDATAGLGRDGFLLAWAGFQVTMLERNPIIAALLHDGVQRAAQHPDKQVQETAGRIRIFQQEALAYLENYQDKVGKQNPDVIYLDPMFPERRKSAKVKQNLQLLQVLEQPEQPQAIARLFHAAHKLKPRKLVFKKPLKDHGFSLTIKDLCKPDYSVKGKAIRFDVYLGSGTIST